MILPFATAISCTSPATILRSASPSPRSAGRERRACWLHGLSTIGVGDASDMSLEGGALEQPFGVPDGAIESVGVFGTGGDHAVEERLAIAPHTGVKLRQRRGLAPCPLPVSEIEGRRDHVREA